MTVKSWSLAIKSIIKTGSITLPVFAYTIYNLKNNQLRGDKFKNKSLLYGGLKNPQW